MHGEHEGTPNMAQLPALALQRSRFLGVDRIWGIWGSDYNIPKTIFYLHKGDYRP